MHPTNIKDMTLENIQNFLKRKDHVDFTDIMKREHAFVNHVSLEDESLPGSRTAKQRRLTIIGNIGFDIFTTNYVDGYTTRKKFMIVHNSASEVDSYNFWSLIWDSGCRVIVRLQNNKWKKDNWLNRIRDGEYTVGEFIVWKKTITHKYYTQLELTIRNVIVRRSRKITHYQYHDHPERSVPVDPARLILFLKMVSKKQDSYITTGTDSKKSRRNPIVIHSIGCFQRALSICALDICLDQLTKTKSVSVPKTLLKIRNQVPFEFFSLEEYIFINRTLLNTCALDFGEDHSKCDIPETVSFRSRMKRHCLALNERMFYKCLVVDIGAALLVIDENFRGVYIQCKNHSSKKCKFKE